jgi:dihydropteroate synthase
MSQQDTTFSRNFTLEANGKILTLVSPVVMGIINVTPDSFHDGGKANTEKKLLELVEKKVWEGAQIIDIGAISTRPGAKAITVQEEIKRLSPALSSVRKKFPGIFISIDTFNSKTARAAADLGADIINDISAGELDKEMMKTVARLQLPYIMMHMQGTPQTMQKDPRYKDVVKEVRNYLDKKIRKAKEAGISQLVTDPGFGFGKTVEHNYELLSGLKKLKKAGYPILAGVSRKSMINKVLDIPAADALNGTSIINTLALLNGADILRVHDVKEALEAIRITEFYKRFS